MSQLPRRKRHIRTLLILALGIAAGHVRADARPLHVASLNLCADQLLLALADREQIRSLSPLVRDRSISFLADEAASFPNNDGHGETILFSGADLVLAGRYDPHAQRELLQRQGLDVLVLDPWRNLEHGREQIRTLAQRLGHPERGEKLIADIDGALARAKGIVPNSRSILTYYRQGWVPAAGSLVNELLRHMGFTLQQERLGLHAGGIVRLESIVASPPDYVLMDDVLGRTIDNGSALLVHPALAAAMPPDRSLVMPGKLAICGGPATPAAVDALAAEVRAKVR
jgi:iron complex transport system substrate-binding protein